MVEIAKQEGFNLVEEIKIVPKRKTDNMYLSPVEKYEVCSIFKI
jgi:D-lyxose ketol-isomerase